MDAKRAFEEIGVASAALARAAAHLVPDPVPLLADGFENLPVGRWPAKTVHGAWNAVWGSQGIVQAGTSKVLDIAAAKKTPDAGISVLATSVGLFGDIDFTCRMVTLSQTWGTPLKYHRGWIGWRSDEDLSNGYYLVLKVTGYELGRCKDIGGEEQLFLATGPGAFPIGRANAVRIRHVGRTIEIWVDGIKLPLPGPGMTYTDNRSDALTLGRLALYCEDSRAQFDDVRVMSAA